MRILMGYWRPRVYAEVSAPRGFEKFKRVCLASAVSVGRLLPMLGVRSPGKAITSEAGRMEEQNEATSLVVQDSNGCAGGGLVFRRFFTEPGTNPLDEIEWEVRTASIQNEKGQAIFEQSNVEVPKDWSQTATNIVASKYFHGKLGAPERESSVRQLIARAADTIAEW